MLTTKGLAATNAVPSGLKESLGAELRKAVEQGSTSNFDLSHIGDLIGGIFGGFTKKHRQRLSHDGRGTYTLWFCARRVLRVIIHNIR
jgi:hypothetical protein